jgi:predicted DNA-binding transcriptional regulator AlpA
MAGAERNSRAPTPGALGRPELATRLGVSLDTINRWYQTRATGGFPDSVDGSGRRFDPSQVERWRAKTLKVKKSSLTKVDRTGQADDLIGAGDFARILGYSGSAVIHNYLKKNPGYLPKPVSEEKLPSGRVRRLWRREQAWAFADSRDRRGGGRPRPGAVRHRPPTYSSDDPRLPTVREALAIQDPPDYGALAATLGVGEATARKLATAARRLINEQGGAEPTDASVARD